MARFSEDDDEVIRAGYEAGEPVAEIAARLNATKGQIVGRAYRIGIRSKRPRTTRQQDSHYEAVRQWAAEHPFCTKPEVAAALGIALSTVKKHYIRVRLSWLANAAERASPDLHPVPNGRK